MKALAEQDVFITQTVPELLVVFDSVIEASQVHFRKT